MLRNVASKVMWVGRATVFLVGLAVILALVLGVASTALGSNGQAFLLGRSNTASAVSALIKSGVGPALDLQVDSGAPLAVNSSTKVNNLNADQLDGKDSTAFLGKSEKAADSDKLDGLDSSNFAAYKRTVLVSPVGSPQQNGTALRNALASITGASATDPYLLKIEPGIYDLGGVALQMKPFVDIEGSGQYSTKITSTNGDNRAVSATNDTELRFLTVEKKVAPEDTGYNSAIEVENESSANNPGPFRMTYVTATASGGNGKEPDNATEGMDIGRFSAADNVRVALTHATVRVSAGRDAIGVRIFDGTFVTMDDVNVTSVATSPAIRWGVYNEGFTGIRNSLITSEFTAFLQVSGGRGAIVATRVVGGTAFRGYSGDPDESDLKCAGTFDQNYRFWAEECPVIPFDTGSPF